VKRSQGIPDDDAAVVTVLRSPKITVDNYWNCLFFNYHYSHYSRSTDLLSFIVL